MTQIQNKTAIVIFFATLMLCSPLHAFNIYTNRYEDMAGPRGKHLLPIIKEAATVFKVPEDLLVAMVKVESFFVNLPYTDDNGNGSVGYGQINMTEWLAAGKSPEIQSLGLSHIYISENFNSTIGGLNARYNILTLAHALQNNYGIMSKNPEALRDNFDASSAGWLVAATAFNGSPRIWSTLYNLSATPRVINWSDLKPKELVELFRTGTGYHGPFWKQSIANYAGILATFLFQNGPEFCKLNYKELKVIACQISQMETLLRIINRFASETCGNDSPSLPPAPPCLSLKEHMQRSPSPTI